MNQPFNHHLCSYQKICSKFHATHKNWFLGHNLVRGQVLLAYDVTLPLDTGLSLISFNRAAIQMYFILRGIYALCLSMSQSSDVVVHVKRKMAGKASIHFSFTTAGQTSISLIFCSNREVESCHLHYIILQSQAGTRKPSFRDSETKQDGSEQRANFSPSLVNGQPYCATSQLSPN